MVIPFILVVYGELASNYRSEKARFFTAKCTDSISTALMFYRPFIHA